MKNMNNGGTKMKNKIFLMILLIIMVCFLSGCTDNKFDSSYKQFKEAYILATNFIGRDNDVLITLKSMDVNITESQLKKMKEAMDNMNIEANSKSEKGIYGNVKTYYQGVEFLLYAYKNIDKLTIDEKIQVQSEVVTALMNREDIKKGKM
jgi:hypothetical protein